MINEKFKNLCKELNLNEDEIIEKFMETFCDGVRRPGSWERGCLDSMFFMEELLSKGLEED